MQLARVALVGVLGIFGCGPKSSSTPTSSSEVAPAFPATRWVPASPSYVLAAPTVADAQRSLREAVDGLGMVLGISATEVSAKLASMLGVNPLDPEAVTAIGIDVQGGIAVFSEDLAPTFVVRVAAPEQLQAYFDKLRERGLVSRSVIVEGVEVFTAALVPGELDASWAVADGWMWLHFTPTFFVPSEGTAWFSNSRRPASTEWGRDWAWAAGRATKGLVGFLDPEHAIGRFAAKVPEALACARLVEPVQRVGITVDVEGGTGTGRISFDLGAAAASVAAATLPVPEGFASAATNAPIAVQWNLDLVALRSWAQPCIATIPGLARDLGTLEQFGVRAGRGIVRRFVPEDKEGEGVLSVDLVNKRYLANLLDQVPMRDTLERSRKFGPLAGHTIAIPFMFTIDYVLTEQLGFLAMGEGLLQKVVGSGNRVPGPIASVDLLPAGLPADAWRHLAEMMDLGGGIVDRLLAWRAGHVSLAIEGQSLVLAVSGTRR